MKRDLETNTTNIWHLIIELEKVLREQELEEGYKHVRVPIKERVDADALSAIMKRYEAAGWTEATAYLVTDPSEFAPMLGLILKK